MLLRHAVINPHIILVLNTLDKDHVSLICRFCLQRHKPDAVTMDSRLTHAVYHIPADRADIKL